MSESMNNPRHITSEDTSPQDTSAEHKVNNALHFDREIHPEDHISCTEKHTAQDNVSLINSSFPNDMDHLLKNEIIPTYIHGYSKGALIHVHSENKRTFEYMVFNGTDVQITFF